MHEVLRRFKSKRVLVVGDVMLDRYVYGNVHRWSPEDSSCPVLTYSHEAHKLGGAANVAANLVALGAEAVHLVGAVGMDGAGSKVLELLSDQGIASGLVTDCERKTTTKTRFVSEMRHKLRLDVEDTSPANAATSDSLCRSVTDFGTVDGIIIQDYGKGVVTQPLIQYITKFARDRGKLVFVDPKASHWALFQGTTLVKPNLEEARAAVGVMHDVRLYASAVRKLTGALSVVVTLGSEGMSLSSKEEEIHSAPRPVDVADVSGAGDTVIAALTLCRLAGASWSDSLDIANAAGGLSVSKHGTSTVSNDELYEFFKKENV